MHLSGYRVLKRTFSEIIESGLYQRRCGADSLAKISMRSVIDFATCAV